jgi:EAL domain-containing protein (putative c-di-GMP-specific phosphodiesterase class I)
MARSATRALAASIVNFTTAVGVARVAEGVETEASATPCWPSGVRYGQEYLSHRPAPLPEGGTVVNGS